MGCTRIDARLFRTGSALFLSALIQGYAAADMRLHRLLVAGGDV
jgi:hypothetical protein